MCCRSVIVGTSTRFFGSNDGSSKSEVIAVFSVIHSVLRDTPGAGFSGMHASSPNLHHPIIFTVLHWNILQSYPTFKDGGFQFVP